MSEMRCSRTNKNSQTINQLFRCRSTANDDHHAADFSAEGPQEKPGAFFVFEAIFWDLAFFRELRTPLDPLLESTSRTIARRRALRHWCRQNTMGLFISDLSVRPKIKGLTDGKLPMAVTIGPWLFEYKLPLDADYIWLYLIQRLSRRMVNLFTTLAQKST